MRVSYYGVLNALIAMGGVGDGRGGPRPPCDGAAPLALARVRTCVTLARHRERVRMIPKRRLFEDSNPVDFSHFCRFHLPISYTSCVTD